MAFYLLAVVVQEVEGGRNDRGDVERLWLTGSPMLFKPGDNNGPIAYWLARITLSP